MTTRLFVVVLCAAAVAFAMPYRQPNCNTGAHLALVQSLAHGNRTIDAVYGESCDTSWWHGHFYANKAPGLALVTVPWYELLRAAHMLRPDAAASAGYPEAIRAIPRRDLWLLGLWGAVLPALALLVLVRRVAEGVEPGVGTAAAALLGFATLVLPFASLLFSHVLAALLGFGAFALLRRNRVAAAGLLAGAAVVVEYPLALLALVLAAFAAAERPRVRRLALFAGCAAIGTAPLLAYDWWAFGSPFHLSYVGAVLVPGLTGHDVLGANSIGFYGLQLPRLDRALDILVGRRGLLALAPVLALAPAGMALLYRRGRRRDALAIAAMTAAFLVYNAGYYSPLGGATPGPRLLIPLLPFLAVALAPVARALPMTTLALAVPSAVNLFVAHATQPLISPPYTTHSWWRWTASRSFTETILAPGRHVWPPAAMIAAMSLAALAAAAVSLGRPQRFDVLPAAVAVVAWVTAHEAFPHLDHSHLGALAIGATVATMLLAARTHSGAALAACFAFALVSVHEQVLHSAVVAAAALGLQLALTRARVVRRSAARAGRATS